MFYALLSHFRGALMGGAIGELYPSGVASSQIRDMVHTTQSLVQATLPNPREGEEAIVATVPLALYLHDNPQKLAQMIQETMPAAVLNECQGVAGGIVAALTAPMCSQERVSQLLPSVSESPLSKKLGQVHTLLTQRESLAIALQTLAPGHDVEPHMSRQGDFATPIALAFYCWLSTADQFQLSILRAHRIPNVEPLTLLLTGAFSGALNGDTGIPCTWLNSQNSHSSDLEQLGVLANQLFAVWSGHYRVSISDPTAEIETKDRSQLVAVSAPGLLRPR